MQGPSIRWRSSGHRLIGYADVLRFDVADPNRVITSAAANADFDRSIQEDATRNPDGVHHPPRRWPWRTQRLRDRTSGPCVGRRDRRLVGADATRSDSNNRTGGIWRAFADTTSTRITHTEGTVGARSEANGMASTR
jgi:hypothetical protein